MDSRLQAQEAQIHDLMAQLARAQAQLSGAQTQLVQLQQEKTKLQAAYEALWEELTLLKHRLFVAKAERVDTRQLQLEFESKLAALEDLAGTLGLGQPAPPSTGAAPPAGAAAGASAASPDEGDRPPEPPAPPVRPHRPTGRRNLKTVTLPEERLELTDPVLEPLVAEGRAHRIGTEESVKIVYQRGGFRRLIVARIKYQTIDPAGQSAIATTPMPEVLFPRTMAAPSLLAHLLDAKFDQGLPFWRVADRCARDGLPLDRGTMCRWAEDAGATFKVTIVEAMRQEALRQAFCIAADATGIPVQPERQPGQPRQACRRGHYFAMIADRDHIWFEYTAHETSAAVQQMFQRFSGYVQVDAKNVFDILFRNGPPQWPDLEEGEEPPHRQEIGCWAHGRRRFWEAASLGNVVAREALARIGRFFEIDATFQGRPPVEIKRLRLLHLQPHLTAFFEWATVEYENVKHQRGVLCSALGYVVRHQAALCRFLEDGRLALHNNFTELVLRGSVAVGRKAWLFVGSDQHAESATGIMSLVASARLHQLDPEAYLRDMLRVLAHWPKDRYIELAPKYWNATRARLDPTELAAELGPLIIPAPPQSPPHVAPSAPEG
jgi:transposase